jgi:hypothetical protein
MRGCGSRTGPAARLLALAAGVALTAARLPAAEEDKVRETFTALQAALKAKDAGKVWKLLDRESQAAAERTARVVKAAYAKANDEKKAKLEKALGLSGAELGKLTGEGFLKTKRFLGKYDEIADSKIDKIAVVEDRATVNYTEADGDKEKLRLNRQDGVWKVSLPMPAVAQP